MHRLSRKLGSRHVALVGLLAISLSAPVWAGESVSSNGLGQAWPQTKDVSIAPGWHVYTFTSNGVKYIQINDNAANVRAVVATANGQFLVLPMGSDASRVATPQQSLTRPNGTITPTVTVYSDGATQITASSSSSAGNITTQFFVSPRCGECTNPRQQ